jgi:hypothetical protein
MTFEIKNDFRNSLFKAFELLEEFRMLSSGDFSPNGGRDPFKLDQGFLLYIEISLF